MITFIGNNELALHVPDPAAAEGFYTGILGCTVVDRTPDCIALTSGALRLSLPLPSTSNTRRQNAPALSRAAGFHATYPAPPRRSWKHTIST